MNSLYENIRSRSGEPLQRQLRSRDCHVPTEIRQVPTTQPRLRDVSEAGATVPVRAHCLSVAVVTAPPPAHRLQRGRNSVVAAHRSHTWPATGSFCRPDQTRPRHQSCPTSVQTPRRPTQTANDPSVTSRPSIFVDRTSPYCRPDGVPPLRRCTQTSLRRCRTSETAPPVYLLSGAPSDAPPLRR